MVEGLPVLETIRQPWHDPHLVRPHHRAPRSRREIVVLDVAVTALYRGRAEEHPTAGRLRRRAEGPLLPRLLVLGDLGRRFGGHSQPPKVFVCWLWLPTWTAVGPVKMFPLTA